MGILRLLKFIKVFFSKQQPWQISLGFVLGMFLGLLPSMRPQSLLLLTLAFCLNVNLAAVFLSTSAFYLLGASLDGLLHSLGLWLLQMPSLQPLWTTFYENPLLRTLQLHHTITLGSLLISTILAIPLFLLSQKLLTKTKNFLAQIPLLKLLVPPENNAPTPILRWQGVVALAAFLAILTVGTWAILPKILANQLQTLATSTLHTQVDLHGLSLGWGSAKAEKIEIADSKNLEKNILEIRQPEFSLNPLALLEKKVWIEKANLGQWHLMTKRTQKAKPYQPPQKIKKTPTKTSTSTSIKLWNPFEEINTSQFVSQVLQNETLTSLKEFQALQNKIQLLKQRWQKLLEKPKQKWQELKNRVQQIPKRLLRGEKISLQQIQSEIQSEIQSWQSLRTQLQTELQNLKQDIQDLKKLYQQELQKLQEKYSNLQLTAALFQSAAQKAIHFYLTYLKQIQKLHQSLTHKPKREKGTYLTFGKTKSTPKFLLKEAEFSIHFQNNQLQATLQNLSSSPQLYPHPLTLHIQGKILQNPKGFQLYWISPPQTPASDTLTFHIQSYQLPQLPLSPKSSLQHLTLSLQGKLHLQNHLQGQLQIVVEKLQNFQFTGSDPLLKNIFHSLSQDAKHFTLHLTLSGSLEKPTLQLESNLEKSLSPQLLQQIAKRRQILTQAISQHFQKKYQLSFQKFDHSLHHFYSLEETTTQKRKSLETLLSKIQQFQQNKPKFLKKIPKKFKKILPKFPKLPKKKLKIPGIGGF